MNIVEPFLLRSSTVVLIIVLLSCEDASGLHRTTTFRTQDAPDLDASFQVECETIVANPVNLRNFVDSVTFLVHRNVTIATENNKIFILIVTVITDCALGIFLHNKSTFVRTQGG